VLHYVNFADSCSLVNADMIFKQIINILFFNSMSIHINVPSKLYVCARVCTDHDTSTHKKLGAKKNLFQNVFAHISHMSFQIQIRPGKMLNKRNTGLRKLEGT